MLVDDHLENSVFFSPLELKGYGHNNTAFAHNTHIELLGLDQRMSLGEEYQRVKLKSRKIERERIRERKRKRKVLAVALLDSEKSLRQK